MSFDPSYPPPNAEIESAPLRAQFTALKALIDAVPGLTGVVLDGVTTGNPGDLASVSLSLVGTVLHFSFTIPRGDAGTNGIDGAVGPPFADAAVDSVTTLPPSSAATVTTLFDGTNVRFTFGIPQGQTGATLPPISSFVVDSVTMLPPGDPASASAMFDGTSVHLTFSLPRGNDGVPGPPGNDGSNGADGADGADGEVSNAALANAISGTSNNSNPVATMDTPFANDPPTLADMEVMRAKMNELITALRR